MSISDFSSKIRASLNSSTAELSSHFQKLASGKRINKASDDAAGLAIVDALVSDVTTSLQGARNALDGVSIASIQDSALSTINDINTRQQELAEQAANGTLSDQQRGSLNDEFQALSQEKDRIFSSTEFNGVNVFSASGTSLQVGTDSDSNSQISLPGVDTSQLSSSSLDISSQSNALNSLDSLKDQGQTLSGLQGQIGAVVNRIDVAEKNARSSAVEGEAAASRIRDADIADEVAGLTASRIRQQSATALQAQAQNLQANTVRQLLE